MTSFSFMMQFLQYNFLINARQRIGQMGSKRKYIYSDANENFLFTSYYTDFLYVLRTKTNNLPSTS